PRGRAREAAARNRRPRGAGERGLGSAVDDRPHDAGRSRRARGLGPRRMTSGYKRVSGDAVEYEVFARKSRVDALHLVGSVVAPTWATAASCTAASNLLVPILAVRSGSRTRAAFATSPTSTNPGASGASSWPPTRSSTPHSR